MAVITLSCKELARLQVLIDLAESRISADQAAGMMEVGCRQMFRRLKPLTQDGPATRSAGA